MHLCYILSDTESASFEHFLAQIYKPRNINALPTFIAPIPASKMPTTSVKGIVFTTQLHLGKQVLPFITAIKREIQTINTPILHKAVVTIVSVKNEIIISWASFVAPDFTKYHNMVVHEKCMIAPATQVNSVPTSVTFDKTFVLGFNSK